ncbi:MAG: Zn-dependent peptidase [Hyperionvirus sp.]|uniref:Zn-dependent peptidase n=1 Tax=Hyperionvirus sp. TaxID=2487770 RepID=A0A3G5A8D6_9VIRU|nr:MAG: Zn-dependent peptidase [Hyperionvirus sp.]
MNIRKSVNDLSDYECVVLENGLTVLVVGGGGIIESAASLSVCVGSLLDGEVNGMAHFLEHMLFLGSEKYPNDGLYNKLIARYNGTINAYTDLDHTSYYYSCSDEGFEEVLDVFANFFVGPLFAKSTVQKEIASVEAEHQKNYYDDKWKKMQVLRTVSEGDYNGFSTGCSETLGIDSIDLKVKSFYEKYYVGRNMFLVLRSSMGVKRLMGIARRMFAGVRGGGVGTVSDRGGMLFRTPKVVFMAPTRTKNTIKIVWQVGNGEKYVYEYRRYDPINLISHLMGNECEGSVFQYLQQSGLGVNVTVEASEMVGGILLFSIEIELTPQGFVEKELVVKIVYEYVDLIRRGGLGGVYEDLREVNRQKVVYLEDQRGGGLDYVKLLSSRMALSRGRVPMEEVLIFRKVLDEYDEGVVGGVVREILEYLVFDNSVVVFESKNYEGLLGMREKWYGTEYDIGSAMSVEMIRKLEIGDTIKFLHLVGRNSYIHKYTELGRLKGYCDKYPIKIIMRDGEFWYQFTDQFNLPYGYLMVEISLNERDISACLGLDVYVECVRQTISSDLYQCQLSNYDVKVTVNRFNLVIMIYCFPEVIEKILGKIIGGLVKNDFRGVFKKVKRMYYERLIDEIFVPPYVAAMNKLRWHVQEGYYSTRELLGRLDTLTYEDVMAVGGKIFTDVTLQMIVVGRVLRDQAENIYDKIRIVWNGKGVSRRVRREKIETLDVGEIKYIKGSSDNSKERSSAMGMFYRLENIFPNKLSDRWAMVVCLTNLVHSVIGNEFINRLRTREQLGYVTMSMPFKLGGEDESFLTYAFLIQSGNSRSDYLVMRTKKFIDSGRRLILNESVESLSVRKRALIEYLVRPYENLKSFGMRSMRNAFYTDGVLNVDEILVEMYGRISKGDILEFYEKYVVEGSRSGWIVQID